MAILASSVDPLRLVASGFVTQVADSPLFTTKNLGEFEHSLRLDLLQRCLERVIQILRYVEFNYGAGR